MTRADSSTPAEFENIDGAMAALRARGLRVTVPRRLILRALFTAHGAPLSVETIAARAGTRDAPLDSASVYRNLEAFEQAGVVRHVHLGHGPGLYALAGAGEREHLYCERCGASRTVAPRELDDVRELIAERFGYRARFTHFPIVGLCADCAAELRSAATPRSVATRPKRVAATRLQ
jgi:Fur family ferric uptake transcriptional regulator